MSSKIIYERFLWFHGRVKRGLYPNATSMAREFGVSVKTAQRDIEFIQDRLFAPLEYDRSRRGYAYADESYELPASWLTADDLLALLVSFRLASTVPEGGMKARMKSFLEQVFSLYAHEVPLSLEDLGGKVSVKNIEYSFTDDRIFRQAFEALVHTRPLTIVYNSPHTGERTRRDVLPLHLLSYMGTWHLIAHCSLRDGLRDFALSRIRSIEPCSREISPPAGTDSIREYLRGHFGIMSSTRRVEVCIRFAPGIAPWIAEQVWHPDQAVSRGPDGSLTLSFPVADFREIRREVLKYGSQAQVISPEALRAELREEIRKMNDLYT